MAEPSAFSVKPRAAIEFLRNKINVPTESWTDLWQDAHSRAFMVAGATKAQLVADFHDAVLHALENGSTLEMFRKDFDAIVARHGWSYRGSRDWRSQVIYQTNMSTARAAGQWKTMQRLKDSSPYIGYFAVMDRRTREQHRHWHHVVLPVDHPFWLTHFPPNGWNCRCWTVSLSERDLKRYKLKVSDDPKIVYETHTIATRDGDVRVEVPRGVSPGFAYNPGLAGFGRGADLAALERGAKFEGLEAPGTPLLLTTPIAPAAARGTILPSISNEDELRAQLVDVLGGRLDHTFLDPAGAPVHVSQAVVDQIMANPDWLADQLGRFLGFLPELVEDPAEIWIGFARNLNSGRTIVRRRYIKVLLLADDQVLTLIGDADGSSWSSIKFWLGQPEDVAALRTGHRIWRRLD
ncbi:MAG: phage minor head protein [Paracoccaceae bacterium]